MLWLMQHQYYGSPRPQYLCRQPGRQPAAGGGGQGRVAVVLAVVLPRRRLRFAQADGSNPCHPNPIPESLVPIPTAPNPIR